MLASAAAAAEAGDVSSGLPTVGSVPWGTHLCHFYRSREDLSDALVPYFRAGLENGERCIWVTSEPLDAQLARNALLEVVPDLAVYEARGQIEIFDSAEWYPAGERQDVVLRKWLEDEQSALADGFAGLRLTGNTFWLERKDWEAFADYEATVHQAFRGRKIIALCSYSLDRCSVDDVLDVLHNHAFALLQRDGAWEVVHSATHLIGAIQGSASPSVPEHGVIFFDEAGWPPAEIVDFLAQGAIQSHGAAAFVTRPHLDALQEALRRLGIPSDAVRTFDAEDLIDQCTHGGRVDVHAFRPVLERWLGELTSTGGKVHVYGEIVDMFCRRGESGQAIALEEIWSEVMVERPVALLCGYELSSFRSSDAKEAYLAVCGCHDDVRVDASVPDLRAIVDRLAKELKRSNQREADRHQLSAMEQGASKRLACLQRVTSALSEVRVLDQIDDVIEREISPVLGTQDVRVVTLDDRASASPAHRPSARAFDTGTSIWLRNVGEIENAYPQLGTEAKAVAAVPLGVGGRKTGAVVFHFFEPQPFDAPQRALIKDIAHQLALTLDRTHFYAEAQRQRDSLERASRAKDEFLAMLGHELRNPLAAIRTAAELLKLSPIDPKVQRTQAVLERQTTHMSKLLDGLLDVSRIVRGKIVLASQQVDLRDILLAMLQDGLAQFESRGLELRIEIGEQALCAQGDPVRLAQVFDNVLSNALKFTEAPGTITVRADLCDDFVVVSIRDTGVGIDEELLPHIFEPFQQGAQELARTAGGLGLGLSVVKGLVELHGGQVVATSDGKGNGSEFQVRIPRCEKDENDLPPDMVSKRTVRLMVVEDNKDTADLLCEVLETMGHASVVAYDGEHALELAAEFKPHVVLCDIGLPGKMNGYDVARALRGNDILKGTVLVALTGYGRPEDVKRARDAGFDVHLTKPIEMAAVEHLIADLVAPGR
jgi:signal transduction histidine kinase/ActR/RegA family two-component response regulator